MSTDPTSTDPTSTGQPSSGQPSSGRLCIALVLKTSEGGLWTLPQVDELLRRGHRVVAVLPPGGRLRAALAERGVPVLDSAFSFRFRPRLATLRGLWRLRRQLRDLHPDVVFYHLYASALAARLGTVGRPVARVHMVAGPLYLDSRPIRLAERLLARLDQVTIGGSGYTSARYRELGRPIARTPTIPYGVDTAEFVPPTGSQRVRARHRLGYDIDDFVVIMVAYVYAPKRSVHRGLGVKGHDVLLSAWRQFAPEHPRARLLLVGAGFDAPGEAHRRELMARFGVDADPTITWLTSVPDVRGCYAAADVSVSPSRSDNHGAAVEAGALGVPSIVSDAGALPETVDERCGWLVPRADVPALVRAMAAAHALQRAGSLVSRGVLARQRVIRLFDRGEAATRVADVIEGAARARGRVGSASSGVPTAPDGRR